MRNMTTFQKYKLLVYNSIQVFPKDETCLDTDFSLQLQHLLFSYIKIVTANFQIGFTIKILKQEVGKIYKVMLKNLSSFKNNEVRHHERLDRHNLFTTPIAYLLFLIDFRNRIVIKI